VSSRVGFEATAVTAHAGLESGPDYIEDTLDQGVIHVNHGMQCFKDNQIVK